MSDEAAETYPAAMALVELQVVIDAMRERAEKAEAALAAIQAGDEVLADLMDGNEP